MLVAFLLAVSLAVLIASFYVWRATSSRPSLIGGVFGSLALLVSARLVSVGGMQPEMAVGLPMFAGMLYMGRAIGTWLRVRKEAMLRQPAIIWTIAGILCFVSAAWVYQTIMHH